MQMQINDRPATISAATSSDAHRPSRRTIAPTSAPAKIATTDYARRPVRPPPPPASEESAASPVIVSVSTVVVKSATASF
jgi:hypothetical protein